VIDDPPGDPQQALVPGRAAMGQRGLEEVARAVELVALGEVGPALVRLGNLVVGVEVAVLALGRRDQLDRLVHRRAEPVAGLARPLVGRRVEPLVDVRVHEDGAAVAPRGSAGRDPKVLQVARGLEHPQAVRERRLAIDRLSPRPEAALDGHRVQGQGPERRSGTPLRIDRPRAS
jgi:hypothetical protein